MGTPTDPTPTLQRLAAFLGSTGVALGALGAHALQSRLTGTKLESWKTAVLYQLVSATALLGMQNEKAGQLIAVGCTMFSGSIYCLCLDIGPKKLLGPTTPLGGLCMIAGWVWLGFN